MPGSGSGGRSAIPGSGWTGSSARATSASRMCQAGIGGGLTVLPVVGKNRNGSVDSRRRRRFPAPKKRLISRAGTPIARKMKTNFTTVAT